MKDFLKNTASLIVVSSLVFALGGCKKNDKIELRVSSWGSKSEMEVLKPLLSEFENQHPDLKIEFLHIPKNYFQKLHLLVASNLTPDVIFINNINGRRYIEAGVFEDLNPYFENDETSLRNEFFDNALKGFEYKKGLYAVPRDLSNLVIYYNKDSFEKYGVIVPKDGWNFEQFLVAAKKLTKDTDNDGKIDIFGTSFEENPLFWLPFLWSNGGGIISEDLSRPIINTNESKEAIEFYSDLRNRWHVAPSASEQGSATMSQLFLQERIAMHISGRWSVPAYRKNAKFNWDVMRFPKGSKGSIVDADASGWAIGKNSKHKKEAWELVKFLTSKASVGDFAKIGLIVPSREDVSNSHKFLAPDKKPKSADIFIKIIPESIPTPANKNYQEVLDIVNKELEPVFRGKKSVYDVVDEGMSKKIERVLN